VLALMKGTVSQEAMFHIMEGIFPVEGEAEAPSSAGPMKIGLLGTLSGVLDWQGMDLRDGALLALKEVSGREEFAGQSFELVTADDRGEPEVAAAEARRLIAEEGVVALVGPVDSDCALAVAAVAGEARVPMITLSTLPELTDPLQRYVFRGTVSDAVLGRLMADYAKIMLGGGRIAILYEDSAYGRAGMEAVSARLRRVGVEPVAVESYARGAKDFSVQMGRLKAADPRSIMLYGGIQDAQPVMQAIRGAGLDSKVVASSGWASTHLLPQVPLGLDGVVVAGYTHMVPDALFYLSPARIVLSPVARGHYQVVTAEPDSDMFPWWTPFFTAFREQYGRNPDMVAGYGYSNLLCLLEALERVQFDRGRVVEALEGTENFQTVFGHLINYHDECHDGMRYTNFSTYRDGHVLLATKDKSLDATKMREGGLKVEAAGYGGELYSLPPNTAAYFVIHMHYGYPRFMKETQQMGLYGGFRSEYNFYGMKYAYSGTLHKGKDQIMMVKLSFRKADRALAILDLETTKADLEGKTEIEKRPEEFRNPQEGVSYAQGLWSAYKRQGGTIVFAKGEVPLQDIQAAMQRALGES
jgi:branched-chain amino acid transport system substrate-binding protein